MFIIIRAINDELIVINEKVTFILNISSKPTISFNKILIHLDDMFNVFLMEGHIKRYS